MTFRKLALAFTAFMLASSPSALAAQTLTVSANAEKPYNGSDPSTLASSQTVMVARGETVGLWLKLGGTASSCYQAVSTGLGSSITTAPYYAPPITSTLKSYATAATINYDPLVPLNPISGACSAGTCTSLSALCNDGFYPLDISVASSATAGDVPITVTVGSASVSITVRILTLTMPSTFSYPFYVGMLGFPLGGPYYGSSMSTPQQGAITLQGNGVLRAHGIEPYSQHTTYFPPFISTTTATLVSGSPCLSSVGSTTNLSVGAPLFDNTHTTYIPSGTTVVGKPGSCSTGQIQMSNNATTSATGDTIQPGALDLDANSGSNASFRQLVMTGAISPIDLTWSADTTSSPAVPSANLMKTMNYYITQGLFGSNPWCYAVDEGQGDSGRTTTQQAVINQYTANMPACKIQATRENNGSLSGPNIFVPVMDWFGQIGHLGASSYSSVIWGLYGSCMAQGACSGTGQSNSATGSPLMVLDAPSVNPLAYGLMTQWAGGSRSLYYSATDAFGTNWADPWNSNAHGNGDGTLFYPVVGSTTGNLTSGSNCVASVANTAVFHVGDRINGTGTTSTATVTAIGSCSGTSSVTMSANASSSGTAVVLKAGSSGTQGYSFITNATVAPSHRLKMIREAQFWNEYFKTSAGSLNPLITNTLSWNTTYSNWQSARDAIASLYVSGPAPSPTPSSTPTPIPSASPEPQPIPSGKTLKTDVVSSLGDLILTPGSGVVRVNSSRISGVASPFYTTDACTKGYVDALVSGGGGGTITTKEILYGDGTSTPAHEAGFEYDATANKLTASAFNLSGGTASRPALLDSSKNLSTGTYSGSTTKVVTTTGTLTSGNCASWDASGNLTDSGGLCGGGGGSGTVTSVGVSVPADLSVSGSPVTSSGTIALSYSGTARPVANGGTGATSLTQYGALVGQGTSAVQSVTAGSAFQVLLSQGASNPGWTDQPQLGSSGNHTGQVILAGVTSGKVTIQPQSAAGTYNFNLPITAGSSGQALVSGGGSSTAMTWKTFTAPTVQKFTATGSTTGYLFTVSSANATVGATYTNNGNTYTVLGTIAAGTQLFCSQASAPLSSGTLTKASGTGDATITFSANVATATYTTAANALYVRVRMVGAGGGGSGSGSTGGSGGGSGGGSYFGPNLLVTNGGAGAAVPSSNGGAGGTASLGTGPIGLAITGGTGGGSQFDSSLGYMYGAAGGQNALGGGAPMTANGSAGVAAVTNTGGGGAGGNLNGTVSAYSGSGGGAGGFIDAIITSPSATYPYVVGAGGSFGTAGTGGLAGGAGAAGIIEITEFYQ